ncbi:hypothetical protein [Haloarchaeobius iranensis]|uniref:Uncharacterized protein n=1 Tax=Haloarchaeobius iranensis TaxID=996166 RepID=A0A1G9YGI8_9EURY|nr:hypothetical protein [Haloarchaeobius iranensis]SDN08157.1 hypothetical protein SAMN05192554_11459 [Haloarchaeobius iranensis]
MDRNVLFALACTALLISAAYLAGFGTVATFTDSATVSGNVASAENFDGSLTVVDAVANEQSTGGEDDCTAEQDAGGNTNDGGAANAQDGGGLTDCGGTGGNGGTDGGRYVAPAARPLTVGGRG